MPLAPRTVALALGFTLVLALAGFVAFAAMFDVFAPGGGALFWAKAAVIAFSGLPAVTIVLVVRRRWMLVALGVAFVAVAVLLCTPWHPRKVFVRDLESVRPGMTVDEAERVMAPYLKGMGAKWGEAVAPDFPEGDERAHATGTMYYRWNSTDGAYDSDWGRVDFVDGRVTKVEFLPD